jgi:UDP-N-acetylglucosamine transferase subunit ALG13
MITFDGLDTKNVKSKYKSYYFQYIPPRKIIPLLKLLPDISKIFKNGKYNYVASTGAGIAILGYIISKLNGKPFYYVESIARQTSLSLTARILTFFGLRKMFVQSSGLVSKKRLFLDPPFSNFTTLIEPTRFEDTSLTIFIAFGTLQGYQFPRAIGLVNRVVEKSDNLLWQIGCTVSSEITGEVVTYAERNDFLKYIEESDVVITHAGIGIIGDCLNLGKLPIVIPRRSNFYEHVDNHQVEIVRFLEDRGLVMNLETEVSRDLLLQNVSMKVVKR